MKTKMLFVIMLLLIGSHASASSVVIGNGIPWTALIARFSPNSAGLFLNANTSGADFGVDGYLAGIELAPIGGDPNKTFNISGVVAFTQDTKNWGFQNNAQLNASGPVCSGLSGTLSISGCAFAVSAADRLPSTEGGLSIFLGIDDSVALPDTFGLKVRWEDLEGNNIGAPISGNLTADNWLPAVPLPAAAWLFASALAGLATAAWRRDRKALLVA